MSRLDVIRRAWLMYHRGEITRAELARVLTQWRRVT